MQKHLWLTGALLLSAGAARAECDVPVDFHKVAGGVEIHATINGEPQEWTVRNGAASPLFVFPQSSACPQYQASMRLSPKRLTYEFRDSSGRLARRYWIARACMGPEDSTCPLHVKVF